MAMNDEDKKLDELLTAISKGATHIVANPETIKKLQERGLPIEERFITYEEYVEKLFTQRKKEAVRTAFLSLQQLGLAN